MPYKDPEKARENARKYRKDNPEKIREGKRKYRRENPEKKREADAKWRRENRKKLREVSSEYRKENPKKTRKAVRKWQNKNPEKKRQQVEKWQRENRGKIRENQRKWRKENRESMSSYRKKYRIKNPVAFTKEMTKYRRSHRVCEWSYCEQIKSLHVHHILPNFKYKKKYTDGNYHGLIGNNFICYCPFHHFAYHYTYSIKRNDEKHEHALNLLWFKAEQWANDNKISIEDLEYELVQMLPSKVILA